MEHGLAWAGVEALLDDVNVADLHAAADDPVGVLERARRTLVAKLRPGMEPLVRLGWMAADH